MARRSKKAWRRVRSYLVLLGFAVITRLPRRVLLALGKGIGRLTYRRSDRLRGRTMRHLEIGLGDTTTLAERKAICRRVFENFGRCAAEFVLLPRLSREELDAMFEAPEFPRCWEDLLGHGKGILALTAHLGNFEVAAAFCGRHFPGRLQVVGREMRDPRLDRLLTGWRLRGGLKTINQSEGPRPVLRALRSNNMVGIVPDHDVRRLGGIFVDWFGRPAYTLTGPASLSRVTGCPILPMFPVWKGDRYRLYFEEPLWPEDTGDRQRDDRVLTERWSAVVQDYIRRFPDQWAWFHRRWNTRPEDVAGARPG